MGLFSSDKDEFKVGDKVRVKYREQEGYIIDKNGSLYMVSLNSGLSSAFIFENVK